MKQQTAKQYIEPDGFKGSKGEWLAIKSSTGFFIKTHFGKTVCERHSSELGVITSGADHDAQLLAYSKDIAKALQDMITDLKEWHDYNLNEVDSFDGAEREMQLLKANGIYKNYQNAKQVLKDAGLTDK